MRDSRGVHGVSHGVCSSAKRCAWEQHSMVCVTRTIVPLVRCDHPGAVGDPNSSVIYVRQFDVPLPVAIECVRNTRREALASCWEACYVAKQHVTKPAHQWFLGFIEDRVRAFDAAMETDTNRYGGT